MAIVGAAAPPARVSLITQAEAGTAFPMGDYGDPFESMAEFGPIAEPDSTLSHTR